MSFEQLLPLLDYLTGLWNENLTDRITDIGFYGGEPMLNMSLIRQVIDYLEERNKNKVFTYSMTTNGLLLDKHMDYLAEKGFNLLISLDGDRDCQSFRLKQDGTNSYEVVYRNTILLRNKYPDYFTEKVNFHAVIHKNNSVRRVLEYFTREFGKVPSLAEISSDGLRDEKRDLFSFMHQSIEESIHNDSYPEELHSALGFENPMKEYIYQYLKAYSGNIYDTYNSLISGIPIPQTPTGTCNPFAKKLFVTVKGEIMQCEHISRQYVYGNVSSKGVSLNLESISRKFNSMLDSIQSRCQKCSIASSCIVCIFSLGDSASLSRCKEFRTKKQFLHYQSSCLEIIHNNPELYSILVKETYTG